MKAAGTFAGTPCRAGHDGERYSANKTCVHCARERAAAVNAQRRAESRYGWTAPRPGHERSRRRWRKRLAALLRVDPEAIPEAEVRRFMRETAAARERIAAAGVESAGR